jgi:hypothetical protein
MTRRWTLEELRSYAKRGAAAQAAVNAELAMRTGVERRMIMAAAVRHKNKMNKLEAAYAQKIELERIAGLWQSWTFNSIKLRLATGAYYTPDFALIDAGGHLVIHETKVAAELYPHFRFVAVTRKRRKEGGDWVFKQY